MKNIFSVVFFCFFIISQSLRAQQLHISNDTTICAGQSVQLNVSGGGASYSWTPANTLSSSTIANPVATPTQTTSYIVSSAFTGNIVTNGDFSQGNTGFTSGYTYQLPPNNAGQTRYWVGGTPTLFSSGMSNCADHTTGVDTNQLIVNGADASNIPIWCETLPVQPNTTYNLSGYVQELNNISYKASLRWWVNGTAVGTAVSPILFCLWAQFTATWNSGINTSATFCFTDLDTVANGNDFAIDDISITTNITLHDTVTVTVLNNPVVNLGNDTAVCGSQTITLNADNTGATFAWSNNATTQTIQAGAGTYSVTVTNSSGCSASDAINISSSSIGTVNIISDKSIICSLDSAQICAPSDFASYLWNTGETTICIYAHLAGNYYVTVTDLGNCTATSNHVSLAVYPTPSVSVSVNGDTLTAYNSSNYQWFENGSAIDGATNATYIAAQPGSYVVQVTDSNGCAARSNAIVITGIDETNENFHFSIYPNPNSTGNWILNIDNRFAGKELELLNVNGQVVYRTYISAGQSELNSGVESGIYLLRIKGGRKTLLKKLIRL
jgi:hypothetical protein